jgi:hypothetical protein
MAKLGLIIIGILIIGAMYTLPVFGFVGHMYTLSSLVSYCDHPLMELFASSQCQTYKIEFYLGWFVGIILAIIGLLSTDEQNA